MGLVRPNLTWRERLTELVKVEYIFCSNKFVSFQIDDLGRFWVVDTGSIDQFETNPRSICPPKLLIFDLKNNNKIISK